MNSRTSTEAEMLLLEALRLLKDGDFSTGVCCCGDYMSPHYASPEHTPTDEGEYVADRLIKEIQEFLGHEGNDLLSLL